MDEVAGAGARGGDRGDVAADVGEAAGDHRLIAVVGEDAGEAAGVAVGFALPMHYGVMLKPHVVGLTQGPRQAQGFAGEVTAGARTGPAACAMPHRAGRRAGPAVS